MFALQVHVCVRGAERALAVHNALRGVLPLVAALAAHAPVHGGRDTGLACVRPSISELLPRQGVPPVLESWEDYAARLAELPDPAQWWWEVRPHPRFGTLEVRVPDAQATVAEAAAVVAVVQCAVARLAERFDAGEQLPPRRAPRSRCDRRRQRAKAPAARCTTASSPSSTTLVPTAERLGCAAELEDARGCSPTRRPATARRLAADGPRAASPSSRTRSRRADGRWSLSQVHITCQSDHP